ncbi:lysosome membrane protein 2-like [Episyrphus balteatus]|uniref:lysosome membrane protein 2-like n=1 Tax=Episyrphus balteatus TaxID=286459 RepID=UPI002485FE47|nr:lysosome membrane protein 2-like [Episyrphus balteatus]
MDFTKNSKAKRQILCPLIWAIISSSLFLISLIIDYQHEAIKEHVRFRKGFLSRSAWEEPPDGSLRCYVFNVTNTEAFLNGTDKKLHLQQIGPIVYRIKIGNANITDNENESTLTFRKLRRKEFVFDEKNSPPGIMDQKIYVPNVVLLSIAAKIHDWFFLTRNLFNVYAKHEPIFVHHTVHEILWNYTTPMVDEIKAWWPVSVDNLGTLHNAFRDEKPEVYTVNIGMQHGMENFFKVRSLNNLTVFEKQLDKIQLDPEVCPIHVDNAFENALFPPYLKREDQLSIIAADSCRTLPLVYEHDVSKSGLNGYKFVIGKDSEASCLKDSMGVPLPSGIFDVSSCRFDVPSAYSQPHFFGSTYNYEEHFEGLSPNPVDHQTYVWIEPKTGVSFEVKYRFQQSIPVPQLSGFSEKIRRFNGMVVPIFWYEYDLDDLPSHSMFLLKLTAVYLPYVQKVTTIIFLLATVVSLTTIICRIYGISPMEALWFGQTELQQTISEVPTNPRYYDDSKSFLPKNAIKM